MQGITGSYAFDGTKIALQPSQGKWEAKDIMGRDGNGKPIYPSFGEFTMSWGLMSTSDLKQLIDTYNAVSSTGTVVVDLPKWGDTDYLFYSYSGTVLSRPTVGAYFTGYVEDVKLIVSSIRVA